MQVGDPDVIVGKNGPLSLLVRCILNGNETAIRLVMRSTVDGWAVAQAGTAGQINAINLPAGERDITGISQSAP